MLDNVHASLETGFSVLQVRKKREIIYDSIVLQCTCVSEILYGNCDTDPFQCLLL